MNDSETVYALGVSFGVAMCTSCGCGGEGLALEMVVRRKAHLTGQLAGRLAAGRAGHGQSGAMLSSTLPSAPHSSRRVLVEQDLLARNDAYASENRRLWTSQGIVALNLVSSPGAGKTTLVTATIEELCGRYPIAVIEGDQQTSLDADRIQATGVPALQINTGKGCHLEAKTVGEAARDLRPLPNSLLLVENVGNLVCPAGFDLGEAHKVVILSVTEGEDKPLKYPDMFAAADLMILTKIDLLPHLRFEVERCVQAAQRINPKMRVIRLSAETGVGMGVWIAWLETELLRASR